MAYETQRSIGVIKQLRHILLAIKHCYCRDSKATFPLKIVTLPMERSIEITKQTNNSINKLKSSVNPYISSVWGCIIYWSTCEVLHPFYGVLQWIYETNKQTNKRLKMSISPYILPLYSVVFNVVLHTFLWSTTMEFTKQTQLNSAKRKVIYSGLMEFNSFF